MIKPFAGRTGAALLMLWALLICGGIRPAGAEEQRYYVENDWNYVEESMDVSGGIPEDASGALAQIARKGVLRVATVVSQTPRVFQDPEGAAANLYGGADIRLAQCIADRMGVALKIVPLEESQVLPSLTEDQCDLAIAALAYTPGRALAYELSKSYYNGGPAETVSLIVREEDSAGISSLEDLENRTIVAQSNSLPEALGALRIRNYGEFQRSFTPQGAYEAVARGQADAALVLARQAEAYLQRYPDCGLKLVEGVTLLPERPGRAKRN